MRRTMITLLKKRYKKLSLTQMLVRVRRPQPLKNEEKGKLQLKVKPPSPLIPLLKINFLLFPSSPCTTSLTTQPLSLSRSNFLRAVFASEIFELRANGGKLLLHQISSDLCNILTQQTKLISLQRRASATLQFLAILDSTSSLAEFACEVEITECEPLPDGRFYIEVKI
ncbi:hypothetical protein GmHk_01G001569 [Glycine max]|nr:hypothetical protein GmHk_01G001569 [Glycine max]